MKPIVDEVMAEYEDRVEFRILDVDQSETDEESKKFALTAIPTFIFFDQSGTQIDQVIGALTKAEFRTKIENLL